MFDRFTSNAKKAMNFGRMAADRLGHEYFGTEHLLLGLLDLGDGRWLRILQASGIEPSAVRAELQKLLKPGVRAVTTGQIPFTPGAQKVFELALRAGGRLRDDPLGTEHLLLGLVGEKEGLASKVLAKAGLTWELASLRTAELRKADPPSSGIAEKAPAEAEAFGLAQTIALLRIAGDLLEKNGEIDTAHAVQGALRRLESRR